MAPEPPKTAQEGPKKDPRGAQESPRKDPRGSTRPPRGRTMRFQLLQRPPRRPRRPLRCRPRAPGEGKI
eukprot:70874-Pyramimonas_sp.AAC.1